MPILLRLLLGTLPCIKGGVYRLTGFVIRVGVFFLLAFSRALVG